MGERGFGFRTGVRKQGWESSDFPILCETCLGDNPFVRMTKAEFDRECKVCARPFTVFRWKPGHNARFKKTELCQTCAKMKNVCQTCVFDLDFGLPVEVRDKFLEKEDQIVIPTEEVNRDFWAQQMSSNIDKVVLPYDKLNKSEVLEKIARIYPYYKRNLPHICTFFVKGECNRGAECPYRHEVPEEIDLNDQKIRDRFNGINDPIAKKIMKKAEEVSYPSPPEDQSITTLFIGGVNELIDDKDLRNVFKQYGKVKGVKLVHRQFCAFVCMDARDHAEQAVKSLHDRFFLKNQRLKILWAKHQLDQPIVKKKNAPAIASAIKDEGAAENSNQSNQVFAENALNEEEKYPEEGKVELIEEFVIDDNVKDSLFAPTADKYESMNPHLMGGLKKR